MTHTPAPEFAPDSAPFARFAAARLAIPDVLPADADPIWQLARAERELARIHAAEQARWLRRCALVRASRAAWGGVTAIVAEPPRADLRARFVADLAAWRRERSGPAVDLVAPELGLCARRPVLTWPSAEELAAAATRRDGRARSAFVGALVALAGGDVRAARARAVAVLERGAASELRARTFALLGLACLAERDTRGAWLHLSTACARSPHAGVRAAFELAASLADAPLPPRGVARESTQRDTSRTREIARFAGECARLRARLAEFAARAGAEAAASAGAGAAARAGAEAAARAGAEAAARRADRSAGGTDSRGPLAGGAP